jgi:hypothetical protein
MSQDSRVLSVLRSLAIFAAFAFAFYFLLVWNPVGTLADVRNYFEHRVRVPVEWIAVVFPVAWIIQRTSGYTLATIILVPIFGLIITLTKPNHGAEFWSIFRYEVYLNPVYVARGFLVCFLLLSPVIFTRIVVKKDDLWSGDKIRTLAVCFLIGFAVTSWEALISPSPPHTFEGGGWIVGWWTEPMFAVWRIIDTSISQYFPPDYQNAVRVGVSVYPFLAAFLLLFPTYRKLPKDFIWEHRDEFSTYLFLGVFVGLSGWALSTLSASGGSAGTKLLLGVLSIPAVLAMIALFVSSIVWIPAGLFLLQPFKLVYFLVVKGPVKALQGFHYLMVPHPLAGC